MKKSRILLAMVLVAGLALSAMAVLPPADTVKQPPTVSIGTIKFQGLTSTYIGGAPMGTDFDTLLITIPIVNTTLVNKTIDYIYLTLSPWQYNKPATYKNYYSVTLKPGTSYLRWVATCNMQPLLVPITNYGYGLWVRYKLSGSTTEQTLSPSPTVARSTLTFLPTLK